MVIFATGVLTGGLLVGHFEHAQIVQRPAGQGATNNRPLLPVSPVVMRDNLLKRVSRELDLTPEQHDRVDKILKESQERTRKVMGPFLKDEMQRTTATFRDVLSPEQQVRFDELLKEQQQRGHDPRRGPGPGDRPPNGPRPGAAPQFTNN